LTHQKHDHKIKLPSPPPTTSTTPCATSPSTANPRGASGTIYGLGWLTLLLFPLIAVVQSIATRVGVGTNGIRGCGG
jgi:hypothetical protein